MQLETVARIIQQHQGQKTALVAMLQDVQNEFSYLPQDALKHISRTVGVPLSRAYSLATFYSSFSLKPRGRHPIAVCLGNACQVKGARKILEKFERQLGIKCGCTTQDLNFGLEATRCVGYCGLAPVVTVGRDLHAKVSLNKVGQVVKQYSQEAAAVKV